MRGYYSEKLLIKMSVQCVCKRVAVHFSTTRPGQRSSIPFQPNQCNHAKWKRITGDWAAQRFARVSTYANTARVSRRRENSCKPIYFDKCGGSRLSRRPNKCAPASSGCPGIRLTTQRSSHKEKIFLSPLSRDGRTLTKMVYSLSAIFLCLQRPQCHTIAPLLSDFSRKSNSLLLMIQLILVLHNRYISKSNKSILLYNCHILLSTKHTQSAINITSNLFETTIQLIYLY